MTKYINLTQFWQNPQIGSISNPRIFNFSKTTKLIKLNYKNHDNNILEQKPNDQFHQKRFETSKTPKYEKCRKYLMNMHEKCMKSWNKMQKEGQKGIAGLGRQKPCKNSGGKRQKIFGGALAKSEREESLKKLLKKWLWKRQSDFKKKTCFTSFDRSKNSLDQSKPTETLSKHFEKSSIDRKSVSIYQNRQRLSLTFLKNFDWSKNRMDPSKWAGAH